VYQGSILLGASLGPAVGGFVAEWFGLRAPFFLVAATAGLCAAWVYLRVPEVRSPAPEPAPADGAAPPPGRRGSVWTALADPNFLLVGLVAFGIFFTRTGARQTILPLVGVERFELTPGTLGLVFMLISVLNFVTIGPSGYIADRWGRKLAIAPGALVAGAALALFAVDGSLWLFLAASVLLGLGTGLAGPAPAAYVSDIARPELRGATLGLYRTLGDVGFVIGPPLLGFVADQGGLGWPLLLNAVLMAGAAAAFWLLAAETVRHRTEERAEAPARGG
ncbi:MAG TPA: MFS transporter, partial [Dehalococcoidia bacterium]